MNYYEMFKQMNIFDLIERLQEPVNHAEPECKTALEKLFGKIDNPAIQCANCLCEHCVNNVEEVYRKVQPKEQKEPCLSCDECWYYTGSSTHRRQRKEDCTKFIISDYAVKLRRKKIKIIN